MNSMSEGAETVFNTMRAGRVLVGDISDYGRPFRLEWASTWEDVGFAIVQELIESGSIRAVADRGDGQTEYRYVSE